MPENSKLPSIRECAEAFEMSRTTVETAYEMLAADGYIISRPQSGFYVCRVDSGSAPEFKEAPKEDFRFDLVTPSADKSAFNFSLWRKYVKNALRFDERLLSYGEPQGECDLRQAICEYVKNERSVICAPEQVVVAAGTQSLIGILCALLPECRSVVFIGSYFAQGKAVFEDHKKKVCGTLSVEEGIEELEKGGFDMIYTSPSHIDRWGNVMTSEIRRRLLALAGESGSILIEDDYDNEFRYASKPISPLRAMNNGKNVIYIGSFSRLLLPSIRISFMILPPFLIGEYKRRGGLYNQTASKAEQLALCSFLRDGHLSAQIKKQRRYYLNKTHLMLQKAKEILPESIAAEECAGAYLIRLIFKTGEGSLEICERAGKRGVRLQPVDDSGGEARILVSVAGISVSQFEEVCRIICGI